MSSVSGTLKTTGVSTSSSSATPGPTEPTSPSSPKGPPETVKYITATSGPRVSTAGRLLISASERRSFKSMRSEEHTSELQPQSNLVCRLLLEKKKKNQMHRRPC